MNFIEKLLVNSGIYNFWYKHTYLRRFLDFCDIKGKTLEIGCGSGFTSAELKTRFGVELTAIDYDEEEIALAKKRYGKMKIAFERGDGTAMRFGNGEFDCVIELNAFHHIREYKKAVAETRRVLKKGGRFYAMDISMYFMWPLTLLIPFEHFDGKFTRDSLISVLEENGFRVVEKKGWDWFMLHAEKR
ncbi:MAG: class I SAM-dependent methyltransferase [Candidatus Micrarchaeota archaeon]